VGIKGLLIALWRNRTGPLLVSAQVAIALAVLVNVAYIVEQKIEDVGRPTGLDLDNMLWVATEASSRLYNYTSAVTADLAYLNSLPAVAAATVTNLLPQTSAAMTLRFATKPEILQVPHGGTSCVIFYGTEKFIETMGLRLIAGRNFSFDEIQPPAVDMNASLANWPQAVIVTQAMAEELFPGGDPLGKTVYVGLINKSATIIGVVNYMQAHPVRAAYARNATQIVIVPAIAPGPNGLYVIRAKSGQRAALMALLEREFGSLQRNRFISRMVDYNRTASDARQYERASAVILSVVAVFVLIVTLVGIGALAVFNVVTRTRLIGIKRALGATRAHILAYFLIENWMVTTCGVLIGSLLALWGGITLSITYEMSRPPIYYLIAGVLGIWSFALLVVVVPSRRAASTSPALATRKV
jgi:putative ABC transport system permease protein